MAENTYLSSLWGCETTDGAGYTQNSHCATAPPPLFRSRGFSVSVWPYSLHPAVSIPERGVQPCTKSRRLDLPLRTYLPTYLPIFHTRARMLPTYLLGTPIHEALLLLFPLSSLLTSHTTAVAV